MKTSIDLSNLAGRVFQVWEYHVSHGQMLIRSPKSPATKKAPARTTNLDLICVGVEYMALPRIVSDIELAVPTQDELSDLGSILGKPLDTQKVIVLVSKKRRFIVVAASFSLSENDGDIFESPFARS